MIQGRLPGNLTHPGNQRRAENMQRHQAPGGSPEQKIELPLHGVEIGEKRGDKRRHGKQAQRDHAVMSQHAACSPKYNAERTALSRARTHPRLPFGRLFVIFPMPSLVSARTDAPPREVPRSNEENRQLGL